MSNLLLYVEENLLCESEQCSNEKYDRKSNISNGIKDMEDSVNNLLVSPQSFLNVKEQPGEEQPDLTLSSERINSFSFSQKSDQQNLIDESIAQLQDDSSIKDTTELNPFINWSTNPFMNESTNPFMNWSTNPFMNWSTDPLTSSSVNTFVNPSINPFLQDNLVPSNCTYLPDMFMQLWDANVKLQMQIKTAFSALLTKVQSEEHILTNSEEHAVNKQNEYDQHLFDSTLKSFENVLLSDDLKAKTDYLKDNVLFDRNNETNETLSPWCKTAANYPINSNVLSWFNEGGNKPIELVHTSDFIKDQNRFEQHSNSIFNKETIDETAASYFNNDMSLNGIFSTNPVLHATQTDVSVEEMINFENNATKSYNPFDSYEKESKDKFEETNPFKILLKESEGMYNPKIEESICFKTSEFNGINVDIYDQQDEKEINFEFEPIENRQNESNRGNEQQLNTVCKEFEVKGYCNNYENFWDTARRNSSTPIGCEDLGNSKALTNPMYSQQLNNSFIKSNEHFVLESFMQEKMHTVQFQNSKESYISTKTYISSVQNNISCPFKNMDKDIRVQENCNSLQRVNENFRNTNICQEQCNGNLTTEEEEEWSNKRIQLKNVVIHPKFECLFTASIEISKGEIFIFHCENEGWLLLNQFVHFFTYYESISEYYQQLKINPVGCTYKDVERSLNPVVFCLLDRLLIPELSRDGENKITMVQLIPLKFIIIILIQLEIINKSEVDESVTKKKFRRGSILQDIWILVRSHQKLQQLINRNNNVTNQ